MFNSLLSRIKGSYEAQACKYDEKVVACQAMADLHKDIRRDREQEICRLERQISVLQDQWPDPSWKKILRWDKWADRQRCNVEKVRQLTIELRDRRFRAAEDAARVCKYEDEVRRFRKRACELSRSFAFNLI
jgi:hypothetical protein